MSLLPPGGKGMTKRIVFAGQACACKAGAAMAVTTPAAINMPSLDLFMNASVD